MKKGVKNNGILFGDDYYGFPAVEMPDTWLIQKTNSM